MKYSEQISNKLNKLLVKNYDAEKGYINAAKNVESDRLQSFFREQAEIRSTFAKEIRTEILSYGQIPEDSGSFQGTLHRNWMSLKSTFSSNDEETILDEAMRGEKASLEDFNEILQEDNLPPTTENMLIRQRNKIQAAINSIKVQEELVS